jgi:hypothetical protein
MCMHSQCVSVGGYTVSAFVCVVNVYGCMCEGMYWNHLELASELGNVRFKSKFLNLWFVSSVDGSDNSHLTSLYGNKLNVSGKHLPHRLAQIKHLPKRSYDCN